MYCDATVNPDRAAESDIWGWLLASLRRSLLSSPSHSNELSANVQQDRLEAGAHGSSGLGLLGRLEPCSASESICFLGGEALCRVNTFSGRW